MAIAPSTLSGIRWSLGHLVDRMQDKELAAKMRAEFEYILAAGIPNLAPLLPFMLSLKGQPFTLNRHFPLEPFFSTYLPRKILLKAGRQVGKSTVLAAQGVMSAATTPFFNILYVTPLFEMIRRFSHNYVRGFIEQSPIRHLLVKSANSQNVLQRQFLNNSSLYFSFCFNDAERTRGIASSKVCVDECLYKRTPLTLTKDPVCSTSRYTKPASEVIPGEYVLSFTDQCCAVWDKVLKQAYHGQRACWRFVTTGGYELIATSDTWIATDVGWKRAGHVIESIYASQCGSTVNRPELDPSESCVASNNAARASADPGNSAGRRLDEFFDKTSKLSKQSQLESACIQLGQERSIRQIRTYASQESEESRLRRLVESIRYPFRPSLRLLCAPLLSQRTGGVCERSTTEEEVRKPVLARPVDLGGCGLVAERRRNTTRQSTVAFDDVLHERIFSGRGSTAIGVASGSRSHEQSAHGSVQEQPQVIPGHLVPCGGDAHTYRGCQTVYSGLHAVQDYAQAEKDGCVCLLQPGIFYTERSHTSFGETNSAVQRPGVSKSSQDCDKYPLLHQESRQAQTTVAGEILLPARGVQGEKQSGQGEISVGKQRQCKRLSAQTARISETTTPSNSQSLPDMPGEHHWNTLEHQVLPGVSRCPGTSDKTEIRQTTTGNENTGAVPQDLRGVFSPVHGFNRSSTRDCLLRGVPGRADEANEYRMEPRARRELSQADTQQDLCYLQHRFCGYNFNESKGVLLPSLSEDPLKGIDQAEEWPKTRYEIELALSQFWQRDGLCEQPGILQILDPDDVAVGVALEPQDIASIEYCGVQDVYGIETENTHTLIANGIACSNCQDIDSSFLPIIRETMSGSELGGIENYAGTPKTLDNTIEQLWQRSSGGEWCIPCQSCKYLNVPRISHDLVDMLGPWHADISAEHPGTVCAKCSRIIFPTDGFWVHEYPERLGEFAGYHLPQLIFPTHHSDPDKWGVLKGKESGAYNTATNVFFNEVLGESYDTGSKLLTLTELKAAAVLHENDEDIARQTIGKYDLRILGVDWGGGSEDGVSFTAYAVAGRKSDGSGIDIIYGFRSLTPHDHVREARIAIDLVQKFQCQFIAHDYGGAGQFREKYIVDSGWPLDRLIPIQYVRAAVQGIFRYIPASDIHPRNRYSLDKSRSLVLMCYQIKSKQIKFFAWNENDAAEDRAILTDLLALVEEKTDGRTGSDFYTIIRKQNMSDDFAHACNVACCSIWHIRQEWPRALDMDKYTPSPEFLRAAEPEISMRDWEDA